ncbi:MAG: radical SAM protein [Tissierellia bacterium]|nr:radical SAM protein [Tissierellia bacterium]
MYRNDTIYYPQDEISTVLLPVTLGCNYNRCAFCSMYKDDRYREVPFFDMERELLNIYNYTERVFLTGADPMSIGFDNMEKLLDMINRYLPYCACVASYASIRSIARYSIEELTILHNKGLRLLYIGFEAGRDDVLKLMNKGQTVEQSIEQAKKLNRASLQFNSIIMYGIAGEGECISNAVATADMINQFNTSRIITMNLIIFDGTELKDMLNKGEFIPPGARERLLELKTLLENLQPSEPTVFDTTHPTNIISIKGKLPQDRNRLINKIINH